MSADDAYWAQQPAAIQQLHEIQDPGSKSAARRTARE